MWGDIARCVGPWPPKRHRIDAKFARTGPAAQPNADAGGSTDWRATTTPPRLGRTGAASFLSGADAEPVMVAAATAAGVKDCFAGVCQGGY